MAHSVWECTGSGTLQTSESEVQRWRLKQDKISPVLPAILANPLKLSIFSLECGISAINSILFGSEAHKGPFTFVNFRRIEREHFVSKTPRNIGHATVIQYVAGSVKYVSIVKYVHFNNTCSPIPDLHAANFAVNIKHPIPTAL